VIDNKGDRLGPREGVARRPALKPRGDRLCRSRSCIASRSPKAIRP